jgi:hypothetical protein
VKQLIKFMVSYAAMLGTFCMYFFGVLAVEPMTDKFSLSIMACILSVCALFLVNNVMMEIQERIKL